MRNLGRCAIAGAAVLLAACGGGEKGGTAGASTGASATAAPAPAAGASASSGAASAAGGAAAKPATGQTHDVKMVGDAQGYRYDPATLTIKQGDAVRFTMVSGGPHNVTFWPDSIPSGAAAQLNANMPQTTAQLTSPLLINPNQTYTISFAGVPAGTYHFYCTPHLALGMKGVLTVQ